MSAVPDQLWINPGKYQSASQIQSGARQILTQTSAGIFKGTVTLNSNTGYFFALVGQVNGIDGQFYGPNTGGNNPAQITDYWEGSIIYVNDQRVTMNGWCWQVTGTDDEVTLPIEVNFNTNTVVIGTEGGGGTVVNPDPIPSAINVQRGRYQSVSKMNTGTQTPMSTTGNGVFKATVNFEEDNGFMFCFIIPSPMAWIGPDNGGSPTDLDLAVGESKTFKVVKVDGVNGYCWNWVPATDTRLNVTLNWSTMEATVENIGPEVVIEPDKKVYLEFSAENFKMSNLIENYVRVMDVDTAEELVLSQKMTIDYYANTGLNFAANDGYEFAIESSDPSLEGVAYTISGIEAMDMDDEVLEYQPQAVLGFNEKADGLTFYVTIKRVPQENLPNQLNVMIGATALVQNSQLRPGDNDPYILYNPETGCYEGEIELGRRNFKFYTPIADDGTYTVLGQNGDASDGWLNFGASLATVVSGAAWNASNCYMLSTTFDQAATMLVSVVIDPVNNTATFKPILLDRPEKIYVWASTEGGFNPISYSYSGYTMLPSASDPSIYECEIDVPYVGKGTYTDPEGGATLDFEGWAMCLALHNNQNNYGTLYTYEGTTIDFSKNLTFKTEMLGRYALYCVTTGKIKFQYNWDTYELTAINPNLTESNTVTFEFEEDGEAMSVANVNTFVEVNDVLLEEPRLSVGTNPFEYTFGTSPVMLVFGGKEGATIAIECTNYEGEEGNEPFIIEGVNMMEMNDELLEFDAQYNVTLLPGADGLSFKVAVDTSKSAVIGLEEEAAGVVVYNLQGVKVLESSNAADVNLLPRGLYIINGKKVLR